MIEDDMPEGDVKAKPTKNQPRGANSFKNKLQPDKADKFNLGSATPLKNGYAPVDLSTPHSLKKSDDDRLVTLSDENDFDYLDQARDRLKDTQSGPNEDLLSLSEIQAKRDSGTDSGQILTEGKDVFGSDYRGDLKSFRLNNKNQSES